MDHGYYPLHHGKRGPGPWSMVRAPGQHALTSAGSACSDPGTQQPLLKVPYASYSERPFSHSALTLTLTITLILTLTQVGFLWQLSRQRGAEAGELVRVRVRVRAAFHPNPNPNPNQVRRRGSSRAAS